MAAASLDILQSQIRNELTRFFTAGRSYSASTPTGADVDAAFTRGLRQFYAPPPLAGERTVHVWSFLYPKATIRVFPDLTGTPSTAAGNTSLLIDVEADDVNDLGFAVGPDTTGSLNELVGQLVSMKDVSAGDTFTDDGATPPKQTIVSSITSKTQLSIGSIVFRTALSSTSDEYTIIVDGDYNLPVNFGGIVGPTMSFDATTGFAPIDITSESRINRLRQDNRVTQTFRPRLAAVRPISAAGSFSSDGTRWELMLWPIPDAVYTLHFRYLVAVDEPATESGILPGGMFHAETIMASCLAIAETMLEPAPRVRLRHEAFMQRLTASVSMDRQLFTPDTLGIEGDATGLPLVTADRLQELTYQGVAYGPGA
ncbi:MAG: hypothetical protein V3S55_09440 [Nitrospiraceae bacterium]